MGFLKRLFSGTPQTGQLDVKDVQEAFESASAAVSRLRPMRLLEERLDRYGDHTEPFKWLDDYESREQVSYESISWEFGNFLQTVSLLQRLELRIPENIRDSIPPDAKVEVVRAYRDHVRATSVDEVSKLLDVWDTTNTFRMYETDQPMEEVYIALQIYCLFYLNYYFHDMVATVAWWNGAVDYSNVQRRLAEACLVMVADARRSLAEDLATLSSVKPDQFESFGFTDEMWDFLGLSAFKMRHS